MMNATQGMGALENIAKPEKNIMQANFVDSGYPSNFLRMIEHILLKD